MITNLILLLIILIIAGLYLRARYWNIQHYNGMQKALEDHNKAVLDYNALDQGMSELSDAYESDSLQYEEALDSLQNHLREVNLDWHNKVQQRNDTIDVLNQNAQVDRVARHHQENTIRQLREEVAGVRRQLDIAQVIISEHDANCLPHIVFDKFKTPDGQISLFQDFDVENNQVRFTGVIDRNSLI